MSNSKLKTQNSKLECSDLHPDCVDPAKGLLQLSPCTPKRPIMVAGPGRSGTTAVIRILAAFGLDPVKEPDSPTCEHTKLLDAWGCRPPHVTNARELQRLLSNIWSLNLRRVGKVPGAAVRAAEDPALADAVALDWVIVMRDPVPQCHYDGHRQKNRNIKSVLIGRTNQNLKNARAAASIAEDGAGVLVLSYEILVDPKHNRALVEKLAELLHIKTAPEAIDNALEEIITTDPRYHGIR